MNEQYCVEYRQGKRFVGTYEECCKLANEIANKTRIIVAVKEYKKKQVMKSNYHYEWFLYTDNLCDGRILLATDMTYTGICRKRVYASMNGVDPYMGATTIEKHRVYDE